MLELVVFALSVHADYKCRQSGICCTSDWDVPVEVPLYRTLTDAIATGQLIPAAVAEDGYPTFLLGPDLPDEAAAMAGRTSSGNCVFFHSRSGLCVIHRDLGEPTLPSTCRHFPRIAVRDWRGTSISLTHYCPTAAGMLFRDDVGVEIVDSPAAFPPADYEGLTVDPEAWPPLLHPRMLMDLEAYTAWEHHMVARCALGLSPESVIGTLERDARILRTYRPGNGSLVAAVAALPRGTIGTPGELSLYASLRLHAEIMKAVPDDVRPEPDEAGLQEAFVRLVVPEWEAWQAPLRKFLAAKAFANWTAYQGRGVLSIVRGLEAALAFVRIEAARECRNAGRPLDAALLKQAFRGTDFVLNHLAVGEDLATAWSQVEHRDNGAVVAGADFPLDDAGRGA
jgi:Fe-S-cluster containining protein